MSQPPNPSTAPSKVVSGTGSGEYEGKIAIVTGASRGIGAAIARNLARKGCSLVLNYTSASSTERTNALAKELESEHSIKTVIVQADMGSETGPAQIVQTAKNHATNLTSGKFEINILINNAGVSGNYEIQDCTAEDFAYQYNVNVRGPLLLIKAALPYLPTDRSGRIVNLSSVSSSLGLISQSIYGGTKAALEAMTRTWARELAERATVNAVNPGPVATEMYAGTSQQFQRKIKPFIESSPLMREREGVDSNEIVERARNDGGRAAYDWEIAGVVAMLCGIEAGWCTGSVVCANGGMKFSM